MTRNNLTNEEAEKRYEAGVNNSTVVQNADVIFSTQWKYEFTQIQVSLINLILKYVYCTYTQTVNEFQLFVFRKLNEYALG